MKTDESETQAKGMHYGRFAMMIATSAIVMFGLMYLNIYALGHVAFSLSNGAQTGPRIGVEEGPPFRD